MMAGQATRTEVSIRFADVHTDPDSYRVLYELLKERTKEQSISHKRMPTMAEHLAFVRSRPYAAWYLIIWDTPIPPHYVGSIYLTHAREVGIALFRVYIGHGYGSAALNRLREQHPGRVLAHVSPQNKQSQAFFTKHGGKIIQNTFELL
jgi:RimJ/RimL family protein N-acetyltransferase